MSSKELAAVAWRNNRCELLDQRVLPATETYLHCEDSSQVAEAIRTLAVRGAPAIGIAAAYGVVLAARSGQQRPFETLVEELRSARPTAVNLAWAIDRLLALGTREESLLLSEAKKLHEEDRSSNETMARHGAALFGSEPAKGVFLTHCNTGDLATGGAGGTAFGVLAELHRRNLVAEVVACEARPVLQGLRLTAFELARREIPFRVICDSMVGAFLSRHPVRAAFVGADRVVRNGDVANKVGTYQLAVLCAAHGVPFYVVAPTSTFDDSLASGAEIPIEERNAGEILHILGSNQHRHLPRVWNPSFDVTPARLIAGIISERGVYSPGELPKP